MADSSQGYQSMTLNNDEQGYAVRRCASELCRAIWYGLAVEGLQRRDRDATANFIFLAELAMYDQMVAHAIKVLSYRPGNRYEQAGFWALRTARASEVDDICQRLGLELGPVAEVGEKLLIIRDKTHFHLDLLGVSDPAARWKEANITYGQLKEALNTSLAVVKELHVEILGAPFDTFDYDGSDAKVIADHAERHRLLYSQYPKVTSPLDIIFDRDD